MCASFNFQFDTCKFCIFSELSSTRIQSLGSDLYNDLKMQKTYPFRISEQKKQIEFTFSQCFTITFVLELFMTSYTMKNILVPIGISPNGKNTLTYAIALAKDLKASIFVIDSHKVTPTSVHISSAKEAIHTQNFNRIKEMVHSVQDEAVDIKMVNYEGDLVSGIESLDKEIGLDLIVVGPKSNDSSDKLFLGKISGKITKKTSIPVLLVPIGATFTTPKLALFAFKKGNISGERSLAPLKAIIKKFNTKVNLLLVKTPGHEAARLEIDHEIVEFSEGLISSENATVYQGVLEHFQSIQPNMLVVFARKRGFFEKLMESDRVYKKDFFTKIPLLVLKNR